MQWTVLLGVIVLMELAHGIELIALFPLYLHDRMHEGADVIGITLSTYLVADILTRTPAGWGADRWARRSMPSSRSVPNSLDSSSAR